MFTTLHKTMSWLNMIHKTVKWTISEVDMGLQDFLICTEMLVVALAFMKVPPHPPLPAPSPPNVYKPSSENPSGAHRTPCARGVNSWPNLIYMVTTCHFMLLLKYGALR